MRIRSLSLVSCLAILPFATLLTGCSMTETASPTPTTSSLFVQGMVHGGQQPVVGAHIYLYQAGSTNYGGAAILPCPSTTVNPTCSSSTSSNASISKLTLAANTLPDTSGNYYTTTSSTGSFTLTGDYTCTANTQLYVYAVGGYQGSVANTNNAASFMAVLGACPSNGAAGLANNYVYMNEVTTVIAAYSLAGFASDATHISSGPSALAAQGLANAFKVSGNMVNQTTGAVSTPTGTTVGTTTNGAGQFSNAFVNTLANVLASCINSTGGTGTGTTCGNLFVNAKYNNGTMPSDTASAMINIAHNPGFGQTNIYGLAGTGPFLPQLSSTPNDLTLAISYAGAVKSQAGADGTYNIAIDGSGGVWVTNVADNSVAQLTTLGAPFVTNSSGYSNPNLAVPTGIAIDPTGNAWASGAASNNLVEFQSGGAALGTFPATGASNGGIKTPQGISIDGGGGVWVVNGFGDGGSNPVNSISKFNSSGVAQSPANTGYTGGGLSSPKSIAINGQEFVWVGNGNNSLSAFSVSNGTSIFPSAVTGGGLNNPVYLAFDSANSVWVANGSGNSVSYFGSNGAALSTNGFTGGGVKQPAGIAIDGAGNVWVANQIGGANNVNGSISEFQGGTTTSPLYQTGTALSPSTGFGLGAVFSPQAVEIDGSGNVWVANYGSTTSVGADSAITELVGAATPRVTPLSTAILAGTLGSRP